MAMLEVCGREFAYETLTMDAFDPEGRPIQFINAGRSVAYEKFMAEPMVISISETQDVRAAPTVYVGVNGDEKWIPRGVPVRLLRKHVEVLVQSSDRTFKTTKINSSEENDNEQPATQKNTMNFGVQVLQDRHPLGRKWFARIMKQGVQQNAK